MIEIRNLHFKYDTTSIIKDLNLSIGEGQVYCLFGPNGCGKSTLIQCILGVLRPSKGEIWIKNQNIEDFSPREIAHRVAYIPQIHEKPFPFKVIDVVLMGRTAYTNFYSAPKKEDYEYCYKALEQVGMLHYKDKPYTQLSGGETQLVLVARALTQQTPIFIMDEPTAHLDFRHELKFLETISELVEKEKKTIVMATHSPNHAFYFENCGRDTKVAIMNEHKIAIEGEASEVLTEENMELVFQIKSRLITHSWEEGNIRQIVPFKTLEKIAKKERLDV